MSSLMIIPVCKYTFFIFAGCKMRRYAWNIGGKLECQSRDIRLGSIVGARLGHRLFYQPDYYLGSWQGFLEIFKLLSFADHCDVCKLKLATVVPHHSDKVRLSFIGYNDDSTSNLRVIYFTSGFKDILRFSAKYNTTMFLRRASERSAHIEGTSLRSEFLNGIT